MKSCVSVGRITGLFGNNGELTLRVYDDPTELNIEEPLFVEIDSLAVPLFIVSFRRKGRNGAVVVFEDIDTLWRAEQMIGLEVFVPMGEGTSEQDDELYIEDLVGFAFVTSGVKGVIEEYIDNELNPLFLVRVGSQEHFIPAVENFIESIDERSRTVVFILPEGLMDINNE